jgi:cyclopropane-fatty-acyl-phospholipid synthase
MATSLASVIADVLGEVPIAVETYEGDRIGPPEARATLAFRSPDALRRILTAPGELGVGRAYVAGDLDVEGDIFDVLSTLRSRFATASVGPRDIARLVHVAGLDALKPLAPPEEEAHLHGLRHSRERDAAAIAHHYDVSNAFYRLVLGPSMTYSCAVWSSPDDTLEAAQAAKHELICRKLGLREGMRLLDIGCGWGGMVLHAARHHGVEAVGVTLSSEQAEWGRKAVAEAGLADRIQIREQDYRDVRDGPFDAISSIGMFEHVGLRHLDLYFRQIARLLRPEGRLLNHGISRPAARRSRVGGRPPMTPPRLRRRSFVDRYVFPDGELHEIGSVVSTIGSAGLEVRHVEDLREHYALTLRSWVGNLEATWDEAVAEVGEPRARIWRLYMAACALGFEAGQIQVHQVLAVRNAGGRSGMPLRPVW